MNYLNVKNIICKLVELRATRFTQLKNPYAKLASWLFVLNVSLSIPSWLRLFCWTLSLIGSLYQSFIVCVRKLSGFPDTHWWSNTYRHVTCRSVTYRSVTYSDIHPITPELLPIANPDNVRSIAVLSSNCSQNPLILGSMKLTSTSL